MLKSIALFRQHHENIAVDLVEGVLFADVVIVDGHFG